MSNPFKSIQSSVVHREAEAIIEVINKSLIDLFGVDTVTGLPIFRVVWSEDQFEHRHGTFDDYLPGTQIFIRTVTETRYVPKYRQWIHQKHILERLVVIPDSDRGTLPGQNLSYEPLYVYQDDNENYRPPTLQATKFLIDTVLEAQSIHKMMITGGEKIDRQMVRYSDPDNSQEAELANRSKRIDEISNELFGDETGLLGQTFSRSQGGGQAIIVPNKQFGDK